MRAFLHPDLTLRRNILVDQQVGSRYALTPDGLWILKHLQRESLVSVLMERISRERNISYATARQAVYTLFGQLAVFGGITLQTELRPTHVWLRMKWRIRRPGTVFGFVKSIGRAYGLATVVCTVALLPIIMAAGGALSKVWVLLPLLIFASCAVHEAGHAIVAWRTGIRYVFLSHFAYAAVLYVRPDHIIEQAIALCGPVLAAAFCINMAILLPPLHVVLICAGVIQLLSLLPMCSDGKTIWRVHEKTRSGA